MPPTLDVAEISEQMERTLKIRAGYDIAFQCSQHTPMVLMLSVHPSRAQDLRSEHRITLSGGIASRDYLDMFGNVCTRLVAPPGVIEIRNDFVIADSGRPDDVAPDARQWAIDALPDDVLVFLMGSRYCDTQNCPISHGRCSAALRKAGRVSRRSAITSTVISSSAIITRAATAPRPKAMPSGSASAATSPISPSRCAAA